MYGEPVPEEDPREDVLVPAGDGPRGRQAEDGLRAVPGHRRGDRRRGRGPRSGRAAGADPAPGVRGRGRRLGHAGGTRRRRADRRGGRAAPGRAAAVHRDVPGAGGAEPAGRAVLEGRVRGLVEDHRRGPVHQDPRQCAGSPPVLGRDARRHPGAAGGGVPADRGKGRAGLGGGRVERGAGHDELRHLHRHREPQGADRAARQGQAEAYRPAAGRAGPGGHPGRRAPADLARLPRRQARRHPVPGHDRSAEDPVRGGVRRGRAASARPRT